MFKNHKKKIIASGIGAMLLALISFLSEPLCSYYFPDQPKHITCTTLTTTMVSYFKGLLGSVENESQ